MSASTTSIVIFAVLILVALGPVLTLWPSKRDRQQSSLRQLANEEGFRVEIVPAKWAQLYRHDELASPGWVLYCLAWPSTLAGDKQRQLENFLYFPDDDRAVRHPLVDLLPIPKPFSALYVDNQRVGLVWREKGTREELQGNLQVFRDAVRRWLERD